MKIGIFHLFPLIEDPRIERRRIHSMESIIYITIVAVLCGAQSWNEVEEFGIVRFDFFKSRIKGLVSIPSHDTFNRFFSLLDPKRFETVFRHWARSIHEDAAGVIAIDGKMMRGPSKCSDRHPHGREGFKLWMVSAWAAESGVSLGQVKVDEKSNEIAAVPELLEALDLKGNIVTADAMHCQRKVTETVAQRKGDYIIALKKNQKTAYGKAERFIGEHDGMEDIPGRLARWTSQEKGHGRLEERECTVLCYGTSMQQMFDDRFEGLRSVVRMVCRKTVAATGEQTQETRYYISSLDAKDPKRVANAIRQHWTVENSLHWQLDVTFREDDSRKVKNAAMNFSAVTKIVLSVLKRDKQTKGSMNLKRKKAAWDINYMTERLKEIF